MLSARLKLLSEELVISMMSAEVSTSPKVLDDGSSMTVIGSLMVLKKDPFTRISAVVAAISEAPNKDGSGVILEVSPATWKVTNSEALSVCEPPRKE